jgi:hypothetical protein
MNEIKRVTTEEFSRLENLCFVCLEYDRSTDMAENYRGWINASSECRLAFDKVLIGGISADQFDDAMDQYIRIAYEN